MARISHYDIGDLWTPQFTWMIDSNNDGVPDAVTDPSQIVIRLQTPAGVESVVTTASSPSSLTPSSTPLARVSQGVFKMNPGVTLNASGYWFLRAEGTGAAEASEEFEAIVDPSEFTSDGGLSTRALVSLAETKDWLRRQQIDTSNDLQLVRVINDVSDRIHYEAGREFKPISVGTSSRTFEVDYYGYCLYVGDMAALTTASPAVTISTRQGVTIKTLDNADVTAYPLTREAWEPIRKLEFIATKSPILYPGLRVSVSGTWGFPAVPGNIRQVALDVIGETLDVDVEHYREDITAETAGGGGTATIEGTTLMSMPASALAVVWDYRDPYVATL